MSFAKIITFSLVIAVVHGGSRIERQYGGWGGGWGGWNTPPPPPPSIPPVSIDTVGASEAIGIGSAVAEHDSYISVSGTVEVPALLSLSAGSNVGLSQSASNYQQTQVNSDGSSAAYQANTGGNDAYANEYLYGNAQGTNVDALSNGWSAVEGEGAIAQADALEHTGAGSPGWSPTKA